jgi:uncharacterized delta-60 repeat protein
MNVQLRVCFLALCTASCPTLSAQWGDLDSSFNNFTTINQLVQQLELLEGDKLFVGGEFTMYSSTAIKRTARLTANGFPDNTYNTHVATGGADGPVRSSAVQPDGKVLVGGLFNTLNGVASKNFGRLDTAGNYDGSFSVGSGFNNEVLSIAVSGARIFASGFFSAYKGIARPGFACLDTTGDFDSTFAMPSGFPSINVIAATPSGQVYVGGGFTSYNGFPINRIARLHTDGTVDGTFDPGTGPNAPVQAMKLQPDGKLLIAGSFTMVDGTTAVRIARLLPNGKLDTTFNTGSGASSNVRNIGLQRNGKIILTGDFTTYNGVSSPRVVRLFPDGSRDTTFNVGAGFNGTVFGVTVQENGGIVLAGNFSQYQTWTVGKVVRLRGEPCYVPDTPQVSSTLSTISCPGGSAILKVVSGNLNEASGKWYWYTDQCGGTLIDSGTSISVAPVSNTTYYVRGESACGIGECRSVWVTVADSNDPVPNVAVLPTIRSTCTVLLTPPSATDSCKGTLYASANRPLYIPAEGTYDIVWTYDDGNGNTVTQGQQVIIDDTIAPVPDSATLAPLLSYCSLTIPPSQFPRATDNCEGKITATTNDSLHYSDTGTYTITWIYNDGKGNTATQNQQVIITTDTIDPVPQLAALPVLRAACSLTITSKPTANDNCSGVLTATTTDSLNYSQQGNYTITWTYTDARNNTTTQTQQVVIKDSVGPVPEVSSLPQVISSCSAVVTVVPRATDACTGTVNGITTDSLHYDSPGVYAIHWSYDDGYGNVSYQSQSVIVMDSLAPVPDSLQLPHITGICSATVTAVPTATDPCSGSITGTTTDPLTYSRAGSYTIHWEFDDRHGNVAVQQQQVHVLDTLPPVPDTAQLHSVVGVCSATITTIPTAYDACSGLISGTTSQPLTYTSSGLYQVHWTFTDNSGNSTPRIQFVIVTGIDTSVIVDTASKQITATYNRPGASYQWLRCQLTGITPVSGATSRSFTPQLTGSYSVAISDPGCSDTSRCVYLVISNTGVHEVQSESLPRIYPVPVNNTLHIAYNQTRDVKVKLYDVNGRGVKDKLLSGDTSYTMDMSDLQAGVYICVLDDGNALTRYRVVKQ